MANKEVTLAPCPFCGGKARTRTTRKMNTDKDTRYYVECIECYSSSNPWYDLGAKDTKAEAIHAWNTRTADTELVDILEYYIEADAPVLPWVQEEAEKLLAKHRSKD
ncbi:hypothetical protein LCGC14_1652450 [marine sediment metagenome]|uniref:Restriction alleviation protein, Lar family n=1 Tax=marine sediment metagenome TaxID=412755 RepID=A0A0F9HWF3_9ZZZZ